MLRDISIKVLLISGFLFSGLILIMIVSLTGYGTAKSELYDQAFRQLESIRNIKKEQIKNFFSERINNVSVFSRDPYIISAYKDLKKAFDNAGGTANGEFKGNLDEAFDAPLSYRKIHDRYFHFFKFMISQYGYYDFFLMDPVTGDTIFTVRKESDFGIRIRNVSSSFRDVWLKTTKEKCIALSDTKPYSPSRNAPAQFLAAPIMENGELIGVVAVQISIDSIDNIMKERSGMWKTGETYLVGQDKKMRSDSYMDKENHSVHASFGGTIAQNGVDTVSSREALRGKTDTAVIINYRKQQVLSAYTLIDIEGVKWAMIAEIDKKEIDLQIGNALNTKIILLFILSAVILFILSWVISIFIDRGIKNTIRQLEGMIEDVLKGKPRARGDIDSVGVDFRGVVQSANQLIDTFEDHWEEKKKLEEHIQYNQKLKAIGTLAGGIAHDFNNILTSMFAFSHIVISELPEDSPAKKDMEEIVTAIRRASELVEQILTFGRHVKPETPVVEISNMIWGTQILLKATFSKNILIECKIEPETIYVKASASQIEQILMNLCTNAGYAMKETGGTLCISAGIVNNMDGIIPGLKEGKYCKLSVSDTGHGIPPDIIGCIFEPFFTTKPVGQGSGMGLSMVYGIVLHYEGKIDVESVPGQGATFNVYLPLAEPVLPDEQKEDPVHFSIGHGEHILFVDDEAQICRSEASVLESLGYVVTFFTDSREASRVFMEDPSVFDLVITDLNMPYINGRELAKGFLEIRPGIPIILTTGYSHYDQLVEADKIEETGIAAFLKKPYEKDRLAQLIAFTLDAVKK